MHAWIKVWSPSQDRLCKAFHLLPFLDNCWFCFTPVTVCWLLRDWRDWSLSDDKGWTSWGAAIPPKPLTAISTLTHQWHLTVARLYFYSLSLYIYTYICFAVCCSLALSEIIAVNAEWATCINKCWWIRINKILPCVCALYSRAHTSPFS